MKKVLVIEDNAKNRYLLSFLLEGAGYEVIEAITGEEGVEKAARDLPDIILMDIQLPGIDGYEATRRIRESATGKKIPIIAITSYVMRGDRELVLAAGCTGYIEKPINPDTILDEIRHYLR
jgi:two-component system, cell cycle response regulator DivK